MNTYHARWWHRSGFWTTGTFTGNTSMDVKEHIARYAGCSILDVTVWS